MEISFKKTIKKDLKTVRFVIKNVQPSNFVCDFRDLQGEAFATYQGDIPDFVPGEVAKEVEFVIDIDTGKVVNWTALNADEIRALIEMSQQT